MHRLGDLIVTELFDLAKDKRRSKLGRHLVKKFGDQDPVLYLGALVRLNPIEFRRFGTLEAQAVHAKSNADSIEKTGEGAIVAQAMNLAKSFQKGFLRNVFRLEPVTQEVRRRSNQAVSMPGNEEPERNIVPLPATMDPLKFFCRRIHTAACIGLSI